MHLPDSTWTDADTVDADLAVLPVGSTEQHGPHAPLGTDTLTAEAIAGEGVARADVGAVTGPAIPVGIAAEHRQFTGSLWVSEDTFRSYVRETVESLASHGWDRVVVVNGHGGNVAAVRELCGNLVREDVCYAVGYTWFDAIDPAELEKTIESMGHGGPMETSLVRYLQPDLIREEHFNEAAKGAADTWGEWQSGTNLAYDSAEFADSGVVGDPSDCSQVLGEELFDLASDRLASLLERVAERDVDRPDHA